MTYANCVICKTRKVDVLNLGEMMTVNNMKAHYYCLLLSSTITQSGKDEEGILGFLPKDILDEQKRGRKRICVYCKCSGASLMCRNKDCKLIFHLPCGLSNGTSHQFCDKYFSYCKEHRPRQRYSIPSEPRDCPICYESINFENLIDVLWGPCCKNFFYHRPCVQRLGLSAGYFFKCPMCNNRPKFLAAMLRNGVFVPKRDASWETVPDAYNDLLERHSACDAEVCECKLGRMYVTSTGKWSLVLCNLCGSQGSHLECSNLRPYDIWHCSVCLSVERPIKIEPSSSNIQESTCTDSKNRSNVSPATDNINAATSYNDDTKPSTSNGLISRTDINIKSPNWKINVVTERVKKRKRGSSTIKHVTTTTVTRARDDNIHDSESESTDNEFEISVQENDSVVTFKNRHYKRSREEDSDDSDDTIVID